jgi:nucleoid DNA-binding protein
LLAITLVLAAAASAAAARVVAWHLLARGVATKDDGAAPIAILARSKEAARKLVLRVPHKAGETVLRLDYRRRVALGVFGRFGCRDRRVRIARIERTGALLHVRLAMRPLEANEMECQAIYPTFRLVTLERADLAPQFPTRTTVSLAGA